MDDKTPAKPVFDEAAPARDGDEYLRLYANGIREALDPILNGAGSARDLRLFDHVRADPQVWSTLQQRRDAVTSIPFDVAPGDEDDPQSVQAAKELQTQLLALDFDTRCKRMLWGVFYGYGVAEVMWSLKGNMIVFDQIKVRRARRFGFDVDGRLMLRESAARRAERMPDRKFWVMATGADSDDEPYGLGLAHLLYWPAYFKRAGKTAWMTALNKYATPTAVGKFPQGSQQEDIDKLLEALRAIQTDSAIALPERMTAELLESAKSPGLDYKDFHKYMDGIVAKIVLSQTMTTDDGSSRAQSETHMDVRDEVADSDAALLCGSFNEGPVTWWTEWNYGPDVAPPLVRREKIESEDADAAARRDRSLSTMGWHPTTGRISEVYGEGYEYREPAGKRSGGTDAPPKLAGTDPEADAIGGFVDSLIKGGASASAAADLLAPVTDAINSATSFTELAAALDKIELDDDGAGVFRDHLGQAMFAARVGGEVGAELRDGQAMEEA